MTGVFTTPDGPLIPTPRSSRADGTEGSWYGEGGSPHLTEPRWLWPSASPSYPGSRSAHLPTAVLAQSLTAGL